MIKCQACGQRFESAFSKAVFCSTTCKKGLQTSGKEHHRNQPYGGETSPEHSETGYDQESELTHLQIQIHKWFITLLHWTEFESIHLNKIKDLWYEMWEARMINAETVPNYHPHVMALDTLITSLNHWMNSQLEMKQKHPKVSFSPTRRAVLERIIREIEAGG